MKRKTVRSDGYTLQVFKGHQGPRIALAGVMMGSWLNRRDVYIPPHKLREFGKACIQIADEVRDER